MKKSLVTRALLAGSLLFVSAFASPAGAAFGVLDESFGDHGVVSIAIGESATAAAIAVEPDGELVTAGFALIGGVRHLAVTRHHADGSLDRGFGTNGVVTTSVGIHPEAQAVVLQGDGKIVVAGKGAQSLILARYLRDGAPDHGFGNDGLVNIQTGTFAVNEVAGVALTSDGKTVVAAVVGPNGTNNFGVLRFNPDGSRDETFGTNGMVVTEMPAFAAAASVPNSSAAIPGAMVLQPDGKVVVAGSIQLDSVATRVGLVRYNPDGSPDSDFGSNGILITVVETTTGAALAGQNDGSLVVGGTGGGFGLARYRDGGSLDTTFGAGGTTQARGTGFGDPSGLIIEPDGRIIMNGSAYLDTNVRGIALARFSADGKPDPTFGTNGVVTTPTGHVSISTGPHSSHHTLICPFRCVSPVVRQADGRLLVADGARNEEDERPTFRLVRYADAPDPIDPAPSGGDSTTTTTPAQSPDTRATNPADDETSAVPPLPSTTTTTAPETPVTADSGSGAIKASRSPAPAGNIAPVMGVVPTAVASPSDTTPTGSHPPTDGSDEVAVVHASGRSVPWWPIAALAVAVMSGGALVGARRFGRRRHSS